MTCCFFFFEIKLSVILTSPLVFQVEILLDILHRNEFSSCTSEPHTRQSQLYAQSAQYLVTRYQMPQISVSILLPPTLFCFDLTRL